MFIRSEQQKQQAENLLISHMRQCAAFLTRAFKFKIDKLTLFDKKKALQSDNERLKNAVSIQIKPAERSKISSYQFNSVTPINPIVELKAQKKLDDIDNDLQQLDRINNFLENPKSNFNKEKLEPILHGCYLAKADAPRDLAHCLLNKFNDKYILNEMIKELEHYVGVRLGEAKENNPKKKLEESFNTIFGWVEDFSCAVKTSAANKMIKLLREEPIDRPLTEPEIRALRDSRLGRIIGKYEPFITMPREFREMEERQMLREEAMLLVL